MQTFTFSRATDPTTAIAAHAQDPHLAFIAGGTDLIGLMKDHVALPQHVLDINSLPDMSRIRCAYFRDEDDLPCNKRRPGSGCAARDGLNRLHAIFGWSDECVATNPSDLAVALAALDANVIVRGPRGQRSITFTEFHRLPGNTPECDNVLERGDLIISIEVPPRIEGRSSHYLKVRDRQSYEFALVSTAAAVAMDGGRIRSARVAMGGVAHKPWRLTAAEAALRGVSLDDIEALKKAIAISFIDARPLAQNGFKVELGQRVALRALQVAGGRT